MNFDETIPKLILNHNINNYYDVIVENCTKTYFVFKLSHKRSKITGIL